MQIPPRCNSCQAYSNPRVAIGYGTCHLNPEPVAKKADEWCLQHRPALSIEPTNAEEISEQVYS